MVSAFSGGLAVQVGWLGPRVSGHPPLRLHSANEPGELSQWLAMMMTAPINNYHLVIIMSTVLSVKYNQQ